MPCSLELWRDGIYGLGWPRVAAIKDYGLFLRGMCGPQVGQRGNDLGWLQPRRVIGVEVGENDEAGPIDHVGGGYRQHPICRIALRRVEVAEPGKRTGIAVGW